MAIEYYVGTPVCTDQMWRAEMKSVAEWCQGRGADPGAGGRTFSPDVVRVDVRPEHKPDHVADALRLPFEDGEFDFVINSHLIEHLADPRTALGEWLRVVKPGGHVCCVVPNTIFTRGQNNDPTPHLYEWSPREFVESVLGLHHTQPWWTSSGKLDWAQATVIQVSEACPKWSFSVVLRRDA